MKAISIYQPWASVLAHGIKKNETRSWDTPYRGWVIFCSAKQRIDLRYSVHRKWFADALKKIGVKNPADLPLGAALGVAYLIRTTPTLDMIKRITAVERQLGDYSAGRFAFEFEQFHPFREPIPVRGQQKLFELPDTLIQKAVYYGTPTHP